MSAPLGHEPKVGVPTRSESTRATHEDALGCGWRLKGRIGLGLLVAAFTAALFCLLWLVALRVSHAWLVRAQGRVEAGHAATVPAEEGERAAAALWRAEKASALIRLVPTQFALEHFEDAWINAMPEEQERYVRHFGLPLAGLAGLVVGLLIAFRRRLPLPWRLALLVLLLHPLLYCGTFAGSQRGSDSALFRVLGQAARPYDALLAALSWRTGAATAYQWRTDRGVINGLAYVAAAFALGGTLHRLRRSRSARPGQPTPRTGA